MGIGCCLRGNKENQFHLSKTRSSNSFGPEESSNLEPEQEVSHTDEQPYSPQSTKSKEKWLNPQYHHDTRSIKKPHELISLMESPPDVVKSRDREFLRRIQGSMLGMAIGDALGAHVEFRPHGYLHAHPVSDFQAGGTWGLEKGQFTDDTSMALCLANSLIVCRGFSLYDQLVRYKWWYRHGYMSSTGQCFDIGAATSQSLCEFERRQREFAEKYNLSDKETDFERDHERLKDIDVYCSELGVAGNGALMRLAPVPLFFYRDPKKAVKYSGQSGQITHGDVKARDACRHYGALIVAAQRGESKEQLLDREFYSKHREWFGEVDLDPTIKEIADGSYRKKNGYEGGIRGGGYIVKALEAALWAFWSTQTFEDGALAAVNLGDDTDTTAAIYGQLAGAYYTLDKLPKEWVKQVYAKDFILLISEWLQYEGEQWSRRNTHANDSPTVPTITQPDVQPKDEPLLLPALPADQTQSKTEENNASSQQQSNQSTTLPNGVGLIAVTIDLCKDIPPLPIKILDQAKSEGKSASLSVATRTDHVLDEKNCLQWSCEDVCRWLTLLGPIYGNYADAFRIRNIDGSRLLLLVDKQGLRELGIQSKLERRVVWDAMKRLKNQCHLLRSDKSDFYEQFVDDDYAPPFHLHQTTYPHSTSCVLPSDQDQKNVYQNILRWIGDLPSGIQIEKIELVHNKHRYRAFLQQLLSAEQKQSQAEFQPRLDRETNPTERQKVLDRLKKLTSEVKHRRSARLARVWHGCRREDMEKIIPDGFAALAKLDDGWFGKGIYFTSSAKYAATYAGSQGCLIMCYVILLNPFPVISEDAPPNVSSDTFLYNGGASHANYQCHYVPVKPMEVGTNYDFRPPPNGVGDAEFDEIVIFQQTDILHQVVVHLKSE